MSQIRVTRDDTGQEFTNEHLAALLRSIPGVTAVRIEGCDDKGNTFRKSWMDTRSVVSGPDSPLDSIVAAAAESPSISDVAESVRKAGREFDKLMFASNNQADVDAYVNRQAERMGHTEVTRG